MDIDVIAITNVAGVQSLMIYDNQNNLIGSGQYNHRINKADIVISDGTHTSLEVKTFIESGSCTIY
tara:strand:+ start:258 stop:455 length:198 start_codon:yes stop_codon:yes gene_type:complete